MDKTARSLNCPNCGSYEINFISDDLAECKSCGSKFAINAKGERNVFVTNNFNLSSPSPDCVNYTVKNTTDAAGFTRNALIELACDADVPADIFQSEFQPATCEYDQFLAVNDNVEVSYSASIGYDREVTRSVYNRSTGKYDERKETVTEWEPITGIFKNEQTGIAVLKTSGSRRVQTERFVSLLLSRPDFVGRQFFTKMFLFTMFFSGGLIPTFLTVKSLGLYNNPLVMVILGATSMTNIIISRTFFQTNIPNELREAAEIDGCSNTRFFFRIVLPLSTAIIAVMALFFAVNHWNGYFTAMIYIRDEEWKPLQIIMRDILMESEFNAQMLQQGGDTAGMLQQELRTAEQIKYALIVVSSIPVMMIYPFVQKHFVKGVTVGAVKG